MDAITDGYPDALTPADLRALPTISSKDFAPLVVYGIPRVVGKVNVGTPTVPVWEERYEMSLNVVHRETMMADLRRLQYSRAYKINTRSGSFQVQGAGTVTMNFGAAAALITWGDGTKYNYIGGSGNISHTYAAGLFTATVIFTNPDLLTTITITGPLTRIDNTLELITTLITLNLRNGNLTDWPGLPPALTTLDLSGQKIVSISGLPWVLQTLKASNNPLTYFESPGNLVTLELQGVKLKDVFQLSPTLTSFDISGGTFTQAAVNGFLSQLDTNGKSGGTAKLQTQTPLAPPSGAGITAKTNLTAKGWTVTTD